LKLDLLEQLAQSKGCETQRDLPLAAHTTFHIGGPAALSVTVGDVEAFPPLLTLCREENIPWMVLGNGSNLLVRDGGFAGVVFRLPVGEATVVGDTLICPAGAMLKSVCRTAREASLSGLEFAYGIPGTVGGALFMNAGAYDGQMADVVAEATVADASGVYTLLAAELALSYRHSVFMERRDRVILSVTLKLVPGEREAINGKMEELMRRRREKQPLEYPSAGSYFKRPAGYFAGALVEQSGSKGARVGDAQISEKHAGFLINRGNATCAEVLELERQVRARVQEMFGVTLEREVQLIGQE
jgi:UDP-N-acetylmuramate dehydrogenase